MKLHIMTSAKGGVGKTLCALCASTHFLQEERRQTLVIDLNTSNPDFSRIMALAARQIDLEPFTGWSICGGAGLVLRYQPPFIIPEGPKGFWERVESGLSKSPLAQHVIVDTNLHPANLIEFTTHPNFPVTREVIERIVTDHDILDIYVWFVWTIAATLSNIDIPNIALAFEALAQVSPNQFITSNVIHVINPYALYPMFELSDLTKALSFGGTPAKTIGDLQALSRARSIRASMDFNAIATIFRSSVQSVAGDDTHTDSVFQHLARSILEQVGGRPRNVLPITQFSSSIVGYTDDTAADSPPELVQLREELWPVVDDVSSFLLAM